MMRYTIVAAVAATAHGVNTHPSHESVDHKIDVVVDALGVADVFEDHYEIDAYESILCQNLVSKRFFNPNLHVFDDFSYFFAQKMN